MTGRARSGAEGKPDPKGAAAEDDSEDDQDDYVPAAQDQDAPWLLPHQRDALEKRRKAEEKPAQADSGSTSGKG